MRGRHILVAVVLAAGCKSSTEPVIIVRMDAVTGTELTGIVGTEVTPVPVIRVTDQRGGAVQGVRIVFHVGPGGGVVANASVDTDGFGLATAGQWTLGTAVGVHSLTARSGRGPSTTFTAGAEAGPIDQVLRVSGDAQSAAVGEELLQPLVVRVTDAFGNPVPHAAVTFTVTSGGGRLDAGTALTDGFGLASSGAWTLGSEPGAQEVTAQSGGAAVVFPAFACGACQTLLFVRDGRIYRTTWKGGQEVPLTVGFQPAWSPDGQRIAFVRWGSENRPDIYMMASDGSDVVRRTFEGGAGNFTAGLHSPTWSPDGSKLAVASGGVYEGDIYVLSEADEWMASTAVARGAAAPAWSPDGSQIAFVSLSGDDGYHALHIMNPNGSGVREVTPRDEGGIERPTWSPDGRRIAFSKCIHGSCDVYAVAADGSTLTQLTRGMTAVGPAWSPDGDWIAFTTWSDWMDTARSIVIVPADAGGESFTVATAGTFPAWRP
jgi:hypothetical protein